MILRVKGHGNNTLLLGKSVQIKAVFIMLSTHSSHYSNADHFTWPEQFQSRLIPISNKKTLCLSHRLSFWKHIRPFSWKEIHENMLIVAGQNITFTWIKQRITVLMTQQAEQSCYNMLCWVYVELFSVGSQDRILKIKWDKDL